MILPYAHISFDLDGTLVHTKAEYRYTIVPIILAQLGGVADSEAIDAFWFESNRGKIIRERFGVDPDRFWDAFRQYDTKERRDPFTFVYPDVIPAMKKLHVIGKTLSIVTGAPKEIADIEIAKLEDVDFSHIFSIHESGYAEKPCPDSMYHVLRTLGHTSQDTLYIGNGAEDAQFAEAAGCDFVHLDRKEHSFFHERPVKTILTLDELFRENEK